MPSAERCRFDVATAKDYEDGGYDLVTVFDALHDMGDPIGAAAHVLDTLAPDVAATPFNLILEARP